MLAGQGRRTHGTRSRQESAAAAITTLTVAVRAARQRALIKCWQLTAGHVPGLRVLSLSRSPDTLPRALLGPVGVLDRCVGPRVLTAAVVVVMVMVVVEAQV